MASNNLKEIREVSFEFCDDNQKACYSSTDPVWIRKILKLAKKYPNDVEIVDYREKESICVHIPKTWFKVTPPRSVNLTEEQRAAASERAKKMAAARKANAEAEKSDNEGWL